MSGGRIMVVGDIIHVNGRALLTQRLATSDFPLCWESPSGKTEPGETERQTVERELLEELGTHSLIGLRPVCSFDFDPPAMQKPLRWTAYEAELRAVRGRSRLVHCGGDARVAARAAAAIVKLIGKPR